MNALAVDPINPSVVYAGTFGGLFLTTNGGASWTAINNGLLSPYIFSLAISPGNSNVVYAGTASSLVPAGTIGGVFETTNGGANWQLLGCGLVNQTIEALAIDPNMPFVLFAASSGGPGGAGGFYSRSILPIPFLAPCWQQQAGGLPATSQVYSIATDQNRAGTMYISELWTSNAVWTTTNFGASWAKLGAGVSPSSVITLAVDPVSGQVYAGSNQDGFFRYTKGFWKQLNSGLTATLSTDVALSPNHPNVIYSSAWNDSVNKSVDGGLTWTSAKGNLPSGSFGPLAARSVAVDPIDPDTAYVGLDYVGLFKTVDGGATWSPASLGWFLGSGARVSKIAIDPTAPDTIYAAGCCDFFNHTASFFKSIDGGATWTKVFSGAGLTDILGIAIDPQVPLTVYVGGRFIGVRKTTDGGLTWNVMNNGLTNSFVTSVAIRPDLPNIVYAATAGGGIFRSDTGGASWGPINTGLTNLNVTDLAIDPAQPDVIYAGTYGGGIWRSTDTGATWSSFNAGSPNPFVQRLAVSPKGNAVYAATRGSVYDIQ